MRVYVSGPYTFGDVAGNVAAAKSAGARLLKAGLAPWVPHLSHYWAADAEMRGVTYEDWMRIDLAWLEVAEAVVRLPGVSPGGDRETRLADELGIPVFESVDALLETYALDEG